MDFWRILFDVVLVIIGVCLSIYNIYIYYTDKKFNKFMRWFIYIVNISSLIGLIVILSIHIDKSFKNCVKAAYYNGVSVKVVPKLNSDYTIEKTDSIFYINNVRE